MSVILPQQARIQLFFRSAPTACPYLDGVQERKLFTRLNPDNAAAVNSELTRAGFRRSHDIIYRPVCPDCSSCVPVRIPVARFAPSRTQRRIARRNADLTATIEPLHASEEQFALFRAYQAGRHAGGDMEQMSRLDYRAMVQEGQVDGGVLELRFAADDPQAPQALAGALLFDWLDDGASAVYSFYRPDLPARSLGTMLILALTDAVHTRHPNGHVYLGYWIDAAEKMAYKTRFRPVELLGPGGWQDLPAPAKTGKE